MKQFIFLFMMIAGVSNAFGGTMAQQKPQTLLAMSGFKLDATRLKDSVLIIIDAQREYVDGKLPLDGIEASIKAASQLLERARKAGTPIIHVVHKGKPGGALFNPAGPCRPLCGSSSECTGYSGIVTLANATANPP